MAEFAQLAVVSLVRMILTSLVLLLLAFFYIQWRLAKGSLSPLVYYTRSKLVKQNLLLGIGVILLSGGFILDSLTQLGYLVGEDWKLAAGLLEVGAIGLIGYSYYKLVRTEVPT